MPSSRSTRQSGYESVGEFVASALARRERSQDEGLFPRQVNCRVPQSVYARLEAVANELDMTPTGCASDLLEIAIHDAARMIEGGSDGNR